MALAGCALMSPQAGAETIRLNSPVDCTIFGISDNGEWAVGMQGNAMSEMYAFRWNLITNEVEVSEVPSECGTSIADDGTYCGGFPYTDEKGRQRQVPGYNDGTWHPLPLPEGATVTEAFDGSISSDGRHMAITIMLDNKYQIAQYKDREFVRILKSDNDHSRVYDISNDGSKVGGWTNAHIPGLSVNRTGCYWEGDSDYKIIDIDPSNPERSPWAGVRTFTTDGNYALYYGGWFVPTNGNPPYIHGLKNLTTGEITSIPTVDGQSESLLVYGLADDLTIVGTYNNFACITQNGKTSYLADWLLDEKGIDVRNEWPEVMNYEGLYMMQSANCIQANGKSIGLIYNGSDMEMHSMVIKFDVTLENCAPAAVKLAEIEKAYTARINWIMPYGMDLSTVKGYNLYRNGVKINPTPITADYYYDSNLEAGTEYKYQVAAIYEEGESELSEANTIVLAGSNIEKPSKFASRQKGLNSVALSWEEPYTNLVDKHYYDNESVTEGFGTSELNTTAEVAIKYDAEELALYGNSKITGVEFLPMSEQKNWKVNLYSEDAEGKLTKLASHKVTQAIKAGERNLFTLPEAIDIPQGANLITAVSFTAVDELNIQNIIGMQFGKSVPGYSDLARPETIPPKNFESLAEASQGSGINMKVAWKIGVILSPEGSAADIDKVDHYVLTRDNTEIYSGNDFSYVDANRPEGTYNYAVKAIYSDGRTSGESVATQKVSLRADASYAAQDVNVAGDGDNIKVTWKAPIDNDENFVTWAKGDKANSRITAANNNYNMQAAAIYTPTMFTGLDGYVITGAKFYPTCDATYTVIIDNGPRTEELVYHEVESYKANTWNTVYFDEPIVLQPNTRYRMILDCYDVEDGGSPLAVDDNRGTLGYSCLINVSPEEEQWQEVSASTGTSANWMMGVVLADPNPSELPIKGYDVTVDGSKINDELIPETSYSYPKASLSGSDKTRHLLTVDTWYEPSTRAVVGQPVQFTINTLGVDESFVADMTVTNDGAILTVTNATSVALYDVNGVKAAAAEGDSVRLDDLTAGIYVVKATDASGKTIVTKINIRK